VSPQSLIRTTGEPAPSGTDTQVPCRISVIVPTRNRHVLLERTLAGILAQAFDAFEVIVIDDASDATTRAAYAAIWQGLDARFRLVQLGATGGSGSGPSQARNAGIELARGDILTFCDDDDFWTCASHLSAMAEVFDAGLAVDLYIADQVAVTHDGTRERAHWLPALAALVGRRSRDHARGYLLPIDDLVRAGGFAQLNILAVSKATTAAIGGFWTRTSYEEDRDFFWRAADAARALFFNPDIVAQHNVPDASRQNNLSRSFSQAERWLLSVLVSQHIAMTVRSSAIRTMCQAYEGDILRRLSQYWSGQGRHALGLQYARRALAARVSFKWAIYTAGLATRQALRGRQA
jgi:cellulose synthase/poly-beta-1,6-N-acetylglucosamine synthase-like glycosyltransferase